MKVTLENLGKKYHREWIFSGVNYTFEAGNQYAVTGQNGSGKSTLMQIIGGSMLFSQGLVRYDHDGIQLPPEDIYRHISIASPYLELIEELTLLEFLNFHFKFKAIKKGFDVTKLIAEVYLQDAKHKLIRNFSSGMKQRLKLGLCFFSETPIVLLDEPTNNLDHQGLSWYLSQVKYLDKRLVIIASNQEVEYQHCSNRLNINHYK